VALLVTGVASKKPIDRCSWRTNRKPRNSKGLYQPQPRIHSNPARFSGGVIGGNSSLAPEMPILFVPYML